MSKKLSKKLYCKIKSNNGYQYDCLKAIEELNELSAVLTQSLTKNKSDTQSKIIEEFGDVLFRLSILKLYFSESKINKRSFKKLSKSIEYLKTQKYEKV